MSGSHTTNHLWKFYPKPASHLLCYVPWARGMALYALQGSTLTAQLPNRGEPEAQPGQLSILFKQQGLEWLCHLYSSNYWYQWPHKRALARSVKQFMYNSCTFRQQKTYHWLSWLAFWKNHVVVFLCVLAKESSARSSLGVSVLVCGTQYFLFPLILPV